METNIWSLDKDQNIKALLLLLQQQLGAKRVHILDEPLGNMAIRITPAQPNPDVSVYLYTYAQPAGHFGIDLEYPLLIKEAADDQTLRLNEITEDKALEIITMHLELES